MAGLIVKLSAFTCVAMASMHAHAMSGGEWYATCSVWAQASGMERKTLPAEKRVAFRACQIEAIRVFCDMNLSGDAAKVGQALTDEEKEKSWAHLPNYCPYRWTFPFGGPAAAAVLHLEKNGGPTIIQSWLPASWMLKQTFKSAFPSCEQQRERLGLKHDTKECAATWLKAMDE